MLERCALSYYKNEADFKANKPPIKGEELSVVKYDLEDLGNLDFRLVPIDGANAERGDRVRSMNNSVEWGQLALPAP